MKNVDKPAGSLTVCMSFVQGRSINEERNERVNE